MLPVDKTHSYARRKFFGALCKAAGCDKSAPCCWIGCNSSVKCLHLQGAHPLLIIPFALYDVPALAERAFSKSSDVYSAIAGSPGDYHVRKAFGCKQFRDQFLELLGCEETEVVGRRGACDRLL